MNIPPILRQFTRLPIGHKLIIIAAIMVGIFVGFILVLYFSTMAIDIDSPLNNAKNATAFYDVNKREFGRVYQENRTEVLLSEMPELLKKAIVDVEDTRFYEHSGVDIRSILRAIWVDIRGGGYIEGASTITQQLARNVLLSHQRSMARKIQEMFLAMHIERKYSKEEILDKYLNRIYFGHGAYGVETASRLYFGKGVAALKPHQIALLVGIPKSPTGYSPYLNPRAARDRRSTVLAQMVRYGTLSEREAEVLDAMPLDVVPLSPAKRRAAYFIDYVMRILKNKLDLDEEAIQTGGYKIYTTLDIQAQQAAEDAVASFTGGKENEKGVMQPQMAVVAVDPRNGYIKAMVGGRDFGNTQLNRAVDAYRQVGSTMKPFVYTAAIDTKMYSPSTMELDEKVSFPGPTGPYEPNNYDFKFRGNISIRTALELSVNIVAVKVTQKLGPEKVAEYARKMGLKNLVFSGSMNDLNLASMALGGLTKGVTPLELLSAYTPLANKGIYSDPIAVIEVKDAAGNSIYQDHPHQKSVLSEATAYVVTDMLRGVVIRGTGTITAMDRPAAGKTGTTSDSTNAWFIGYTPDLAAVVWLGNDSQKIPVKVGNTVYGSIKAAEIWGRFMKQALAKSPPLDFVMPEGVSAGVEICAQTGEAATPSCPETRFEIFLTEMVPSQPCQVHGGGGPIVNPDNTPDVSLTPSPQANWPNPTPGGRRRYIAVKICTESGLVAGAFCPENQVVTETFVTGEEPTHKCNVHR